MILRYWLTNVKLGPKALPPANPLAYSDTWS